MGPLGVVWREGFDMTADGERFLMVRTSREKGQQKLRVVQDWISEFQK